MGQEYLPDIPIFVYHGSLDGIVPIPDVHSVYKNWCDWGIDSFEFAEDSLNGYLTEIVVGAPAAITWLDARFDGQPVVEGCKKTTRITNFLIQTFPIQLEISSKVFLIHLLPHNWDLVSHLIM